MTRRNMTGRNTGRNTTRQSEEIRRRSIATAPPATPLTTATTPPVTATAPLTTVTTCPAAVTTPPVTGFPRKRGAFSWGAAKEVP